MVRGWRMTGIVAILLAFGVAGSASATGPNGPIRRISGAEAQAASGNTITRDRCMATCRQNSRSDAQCPATCTTGQCYHNPNSGRSYCVR